MKSVESGCAHLLSHCARIKSGERLLIVCDEKTQAIGAMMAAVAAGLTQHVQQVLVKALGMHGQEPSEEVAQKMLNSDVICGLTSKSMAHTQARFKATAKGARYLSLPDYDWSVLSDEALHVDFETLTPVCDTLTERLSSGSTVKITTPAGTILSCSIEGRTGNAAPGWCRGPGSLASPPDSESNIALREDLSEGVLVVDGSIPYDGLGVLSESVRFNVTNGRIVDMKVADKQIGQTLERLLFDGNQQEQKRVLAELGIGLNPKARLNGKMLIDEGALGTFHIGVGSNATIGGINKVDFHLDLVMRHPTMIIDGDIVIKDGEIKCAKK